MHTPILKTFRNLSIIGVIAGVVLANFNTAAAAAISAPPTVQQDRIGLYHWSFDNLSQAATSKLGQGTDAAAKLGTRTIRVALTAADSYSVNSGAMSLTSIAGQPAYKKLFADPRFSTYLLTTYSNTDLQASWSDGYSMSEKRTTRDEMFALTKYLLQNYQHKKFILLNWEGDAALQGYASSNTVAWSGYTDWMKARVSGVADARYNVGGGSTSKVYSGLEFNAVRRLDSGARCDSNGNKCVISYVAPRVKADYYSYSAWQSLDPLTISTESVGSRLSADLTTAYNYVAPFRSGLTHANFLVGEFGTPRDFSGECIAAIRTQKAIKALEAWGASYGIFWQTFDNDPAKGELFLGYGAYKRDGSMSLPGRILQNLYGTGQPTVPSATCATINSGGIVDGKTFTPTIHRGAVISIFGSDFSASGNIVWIKQNGKFYSVKAGSQWWYESPHQINATLPAGITAGERINVYVTRADGLDSNGQLITVLP